MALAELLVQETVVCQEVSVVFSSGSTSNLSRNKRLCPYTEICKVAIAFHIFHVRENGQWPQSIRRTRENGDDDMED